MISIGLIALLPLVLASAKALIIIQSIIRLLFFILRDSSLEFFNLPFNIAPFFHDPAVQPTRAVD
jgi:hypothetical protein